MTLRASAFKPARLALAAAIASVAAACGMVAETSDSESHFLVLCQGSCAQGLSCICGACTAPCSADETCRGLAAQSSCRALGDRDCAGPAAASVCDAACGADADCRALGAQYGCVDGYCRADAVMITGSGGSGPELPDRGAGSVGGSGLPDGAGSAGGASAQGGGGTSATGVGGIGSGGSGSPDLPPGAECCPGVGIIWGKHVLTDACTYANSGTDSWLCQSEMPACADPLRLDGEDVSALLALPDVVAALGEAPVTFGWSGNVPDTSPARVWVAGAEIFVWRQDCLEPPSSTPRPDCRPIPAGIRQLVDGLDTLAIQQSARGTCAPNATCYAAPVLDIDGDYDAAAFTYDPARGICVPFTSAYSEDVFPTAEACDQACRNDPCASGSLLAAGAPPECPGQGVTVNWPSDTGPISRCFANGTRACLCACQVSGAPLESCRIDEVNPPAARCEAP